MYKRILLLLLLGVYLSADAQYKPMVKRVPSQLDTVMLPTYPDRSIPNALQKNDANRKLIKKGNNGNGFDIYESTVDNMPVLVPDKENLASLGVKGNKQFLFDILPQKRIAENYRAPQSFLDSFNIPPFKTDKFVPKKK